MSSCPGVQECRAVVCWVPTVALVAPAQPIPVVWSDPPSMSIDPSATLWNSGVSNLTSSPLQLGRVGPDWGRSGLHAGHVDQGTADHWFLACPPNAHPPQQHSVSGACATTGFGEGKSRSALRRRRRQRVAAFVWKSDDERESKMQESAARVDHAGERADMEAEQVHNTAHGLLTGLSAGGHEQELAIGSFRQLAFSDQESSRAAQSALSKASAQDAALLASGLRGHVLEATQSMHANYVVQKVVEVLPTASARFVAEELLGSGADVARNRFGCRVLCRLLEFQSSSGVADQLFGEVSRSAETLVRDDFGSFVMGHVLEHGAPEQRHRVLSALRADAHMNAADKLGSHIVEAALQHCLPDDKRALASDLLASPDQLILLAHGQFGCHVVKSLLRMPEHQHHAAALLRPATEQLQASKYGKHVLAAMPPVLSD